MKNKPFSISRRYKRLSKTIFKTFGKFYNPSILLAVGLSCLLIWGVREVHTATSLSFSETVSVNQVDGRVIFPVQISIPSLSINLPIEETLIQNGIWQIGKKGVSHLATSAYPGNEGNVILYGHNTNDRLGRLIGIKTGDKVLVTSKNGRQFTYVVKTIEIVNPTDIARLVAYDKETLTIYTCTGFADLKRLLVKAQRV